MVEQNIQIMKEKERIKTAIKCMQEENEAEENEG